jgi:hypothetical protein
MDQANGSRGSSLPPLLCWKHDEKQRYRCRERRRGKGKQRLRESSAPVLPGSCVFNFFFKVRWPRVRHQQPHQQRRGYGKATLIEESDGDETKHQVGASPEPDVLMKHVEYKDSQNKQDVSHGGEKVSSPFGECQGPQKAREPHTDFWIKFILCLMCVFVAQLWLTVLARRVLR